MKLLILLGLVLVAKYATAADDGIGETASMESGVSQAVVSYEMFMKASYNGTCNSCGCKACCPKIVRNCPPKWVGSVIEPFSGWRGNAAIIVDWGCTEYTPCFCPGRCSSRGRLCTVQDTGFRWFVDWGDGGSSAGAQQHLGPFQATHQYSKSCRSRTYGVTVFYCHSPGCPAEKCCDTIYREIDVSEDPGRGHLDIDYTKPLEEGNKLY